LKANRVWVSEALSWLIMQISQVHWITGKAFKSGLGASVWNLESTVASSQSP
jgi:hypothetical protein